MAIVGKAFAGQAEDVPVIGIACLNKVTNGPAFTRFLGDIGSNRSSGLHRSSLPNQRLSVAHRLSVADNPRSLVRLSSMNESSQRVKLGSCCLFTQVFTNDSHGPGCLWARGCPVLLSSQ